MPTTPTPNRLAIDARPRGPRGPLAVERVRGRTVLDYLLEHAERLHAAPVSVHGLREDLETLRDGLGSRSREIFSITSEPPVNGAAVLRTDRLYDGSRLRKVVRAGGDPEVAVLWRLDGPHALAAAGDELVRRQSFQPLGRYWALAPARALARSLAPTRVRPNGVTLAASAVFLGGAALVAFGRAGFVANGLAAAALAVALVLDTADGHLARLQGTTSEFGRWLDSWLDEVGDMALHAAAAWGAYTRTGSVVWLLLGMLYAMGKFVFVAGTLEPGGADGVDAAPIPHTSGPARLMRLAGHADVRWHLWIVLAACGRLDAALAAYAAYFPARAVLGAWRKAVSRG